MPLNFERCRLPPFNHQREDAQAVIDHPFYFITSEMRTGKTKIVIDAAQFMFEERMIDRVLVIAPAPVRDVWYDKDLGEIAKHSWDTMPAYVQEFHTKSRAWSHKGGGVTALDGSMKIMVGLHWLVTNYEFVRAKTRLIQLLPFCTPKTLLVLDESSFVKNHNAEQTKACKQLRNACGRVVLLNGTPISHSPLDLFSQGNLLHPSILDCKFITHYKAKYAVMSPVLGYNRRPLLDKWNRPIQQVASWTNLEDLQQRFAPYTVRRLQSECLDLPPKLDPITLTAILDDTTWTIYKEMRDECVAMFDNGNASVAAQAATKTIRLAQITSGFVGGVQSLYLDDLDDETADTNLPVDASGVREVGREKLDVLLWFLGQRLEQAPNLHIVVWCRFRPELFRMLDAVKAQFPQFAIGAIVGQQKKAERTYAMGLLKPETSPKTPVFVGGTFGTGSFGLDFSAANHSVNCSFDYSLGKYKQSGDRIYGPGMIGPAAYFDIVATGPKGQKTIDHAIVLARRNNEDVATWTSAAWVKALSEE